MKTASELFLLGFLVFSSFYEGLGFGLGIYCKGLRGLRAHVELKRKVYGSGSGNPENPKP